MIDGHPPPKLNLQSCAGHVAGMAGQLSLGASAATSTGECQSSAKSVADASNKWISSTIKNKNMGIYDIKIYKVG